MPVTGTDAYKRLRDGRLYDLTEFGRAVHAEMEALLCCARSGVSPRFGSLFTTTFPCHNCAKHIIAAGIN
jgi:deoxycytidylate deaminase